jgi:ribA/ribD-fused uncharacterized protein
MSKQIHRSTKPATKTASKSEELSAPPYIAFWGGQDIYSQWHSSKFKFDSKVRQELTDTITSLSIFSDHPEIIAEFEGTYNCAEQFMMLGKALLFEDKTIADEIRAEHTPAKQKKLGRRVHDFDNGVWMRYATDIVTLGSYLKFSQNWRLKKDILASGDATLIEGSPLDKIWGVGLRYDNPAIANPKNWKGQNLLGKCLMRAREIIQAEQD